jgi:hypothetical protein
MLTGNNTLEGWQHPSFFFWTKISNFIKIIFKYVEKYEKKEEI